MLLAQACVRFCVALRACLCVVFRPAPHHFSRARSTALREAYAFDPSASFEARLARLQSGTKGCDTDMRGCGQARAILHALERQPSVYTISLAWEAAQAAQEDVVITMQARSMRCACFVVSARADRFRSHRSLFHSLASPGAGHHAAPRADLLRPARRGGQLRAARRRVLLRQPLRLLCSHGR
jgi:hypothetical protein